MRARLATHGAVRVLLVLAVLFVVNVAAERANYAADLTPGRRLSLDPELRRVVRSVSKNLELTAFIAPGPTRDQLDDVFRRVRRANSRIRYRFVDPDVQIDLVNHYGIRYYGTVVLESGGRREDATSPTTQEIASAILRLQRTGQPTICFTSGHGERSPDDSGAEGTALLARLVESNGYRRETLANLSAGPVPERCAVVAVVGAKVNLADTEMIALRDYLRADGRLLVLTDAEAATSVDGLLGESGITVEHGLVTEDDTNRKLASNPLLVLVPTYESANPIVDGLSGATVFPKSAAFSVPNRQPRDGLFVSVLARTSADSWLVRDPAATSVDPNRDRKGPVVLAAAADDSHQVQDNGRVSVRRSRIAAFASADLAANLFISQLANQLLLIRSLNWLTQAENVVGIRSASPDPEPIVVTSHRYRMMVAVNAVGLPSVVVLLAAGIWWWRRRV